MTPSASTAKRRKDFDITLEDLKQQWDAQKGICPYTGWQLKNMPSYSDQLPKTPDRASLDRINSSKGYVKGNNQFVALIAQFAKNEWTDSVLENFVDAFVNNKRLIWEQHFDLTFTYSFLELQYPDLKQGVVSVER